MARTNGKKKAPAKKSNERTEEETAAIARATESAFGEAETDAGQEDVSGRWARGLEDGDEIIGYYLGYDQVMTRFGKPKSRHVFAEAFGRDENGDPLEPDPDGTITVFGASHLNNSLKELDLGAKVRVTRIGEVEGQSRTVFRVTRLTGEIDRKRHIGRKDMPVPQQGGYPENWTGPRG